MPVKLKLVALLFAILCAPLDAFAEVPGFTLALKTGQYIPALDGYSSSVIKGMNVGYSFGAWALEFERVEGTLDDNATISGEDFAGRLDVTTSAMFASYRSSSNYDLYFLAKLGYLSQSVDYGANSSGESAQFSVDDSGISYGVGLGYRLYSDLSFECEYSRIDSDLSLLGLSVRALF